MAAIRRCFATAVLIFSLGLAVPVMAQLPPMACNTLANTPLVRGDGYTERIGDVLIVCTGGVPTASGNFVPTANITLSLNTHITSKVTAATASNAVLFNEALLIVDEPNTVSFGQVQHPILNCGQTNALDDGILGPGVCSIVSTGDPKFTNDGSPGHPNVFQGRIVNGSDFTAIQFVGVPIDPPGVAPTPFVATRTFRITNLRVDATGCPASTICTILATVNVSSPVVGLIATTSVGILRPGILSQVLSTGEIQTPATVRVTAGFPAALKARNISFLVGDHSGTPGNLPNANTVGTNYPGDIAQNIPNALYQYFAEGGFQWQNDSVNGPPFPNPPFGFGGSPVPDLGNPLFSIGAGGLNTGIQDAGTVNAGTRIALSFSNIPSDYFVRIPNVIYFHPNGDTATNLGVMVLTNTDSAGAGPFSRVLAGADGTAVVNAGLAVYEVLYADPNSIGYADIPCTLTHKANSHGPQIKTDVSVSVSLAPFYVPGNGATQPTPNAQFSSPTAVPRFRPGTPAALFPASGKGNGKP